jgi:hypothetical protein
VIVVSGNLGSNAGRGTSATGIAERVAALGAAVEIVGILGLDAVGDRALLALGAAGVGHAAVARSPAGSLEPADLDLALRYLPDIGAIVLVEPTGDLASTATAAAGWSGAGLIVVVAAEGAPQADEGGPDLGDRAILLAAPARDPDGSFAGFVAALAVRLAAGATAADAWRETATALGVEALSAPSTA